MAAVGCLLALLWTISPASAQDADVVADLQPLPEQISAGFDQMFATIEVQKEDIEILEERVGDDESLIARLLGTRRDRLWTAMFQNTVTLARDVAAQKTDGKDISAYQDRIIDELTSLPDGVYGAGRGHSATFGGVRSRPNHQHGHGRSHGGTATQPVGEFDGAVGWKYAGRRHHGRQLASLRHSRYPAE